MTKKIFALLPLFISAVALSLLPETVAAAEGLVPCDGTDCELCHFVALGNRIISWLFGLVFVLFGVLAFVAGFGLVTSGGNQSALDAAKQKLSNAVLGLIIVFSAWLIVDTLVKAVIDDGNVGEAVDVGGLGPWYQIECNFGGQTPVAPAPNNRGPAPYRVLFSFTEDFNSQAYADRMNDCTANANASGVFISNNGSIYTVECRQTQ